MRAATPQPSNPRRRPDGAGHAILTLAAAWLLALGFDMFLHGGLLARLYAEPGPFLVGPEDTFRRIPLGYLTFLILTVALYWILGRLGIRGAMAGFQFGAVAGAVVWGALGVGLYSVSTATVAVLAGWWVGQAIELGLVGAVLGAAAGGTPMKRLWLVVLAAAIAFIAATLLLRSSGLAPAMKVVP